MNLYAMQTHQCPACGLPVRHTDLKLQIATTVDVWTLNISIPAKHGMYFRIASHSPETTCWLSRRLSPGDLKKGAVVSLLTSPHAVDYLPKQPGVLSHFTVSLASARCLGYLQTADCSSG